MAFLNDEAYDQGLDWVTANGTRIDLCSQEPTTYAEATSTYTLANKTGLTTEATQDGAVDGRRVFTEAITDGDTTGTGTVTHWALTDGSSILVATGELAAPISVEDSNQFTLDGISIAIRDATQL